MIKTTKTTVTKKGGLWAVPKYEIKPGEFPFNYELNDSPSYHWNNRAILVQEVELSAEVPEGIDLFSRAIETVSVKEAEALKQYNDAMAQLAEMRKSLLLLAAPAPEPEGTYEVLLAEEAENNGPGQDFEYVEGGIVLADGVVIPDDEFGPIHEPDDRYVCKGCGSIGFEKSILGEGRCTFCDGTYGGNPPLKS